MLNIVFQILIWIGAILLGTITGEWLRAFWKMGCYYRVKWALDYSGINDRFRRYEREQGRKA